MVIKSGEGVVILTRPQKFSQSSSPSTKHKDSNKQQLAASYLHPDFLPRPTKTEANSPNMAPFSLNIAHASGRIQACPCRSGQSNELK